MHPFESKNLENQEDASMKIVVGECAWMSACVRIITDSTLLHKSFPQISGGRHDPHDWAVSAKLMETRMNYMAPLSNGSITWLLNIALARITYVLLRRRFFLIGLIHSHSYQLITLPVFMQISSNYSVPFHDKSSYSCTAMTPPIHLYPP